MNETTEPGWGMHGCGQEMGEEKMDWRRKEESLTLEASHSHRKSVFNFNITTSSSEENCFYLHSTVRRIEISQTYASLLPYQVLQRSETEKRRRRNICFKKVNKAQWGGRMGSNQSRQSKSLPGSSSRAGKASLICFVGHGSDKSGQRWGGQEVGLTGGAWTGSSSA